MFPLAISFIVTGVAWRWLETPSSGINLLFDAVGLDFLMNGWFTDPNIGILGVVLAAFWQMSGYVMALYLAGLRGISDDVREAARVDGASEWQLFWHVILPLLHPITLTAVIILGHISLKIFDLTVSMTGPGPGFATDVPSLFMYQTTFFGSRFSQGAADRDGAAAPGQHPDHPVPDLQRPHGGSSDERAGGWTSPRSSTVRPGRIAIYVTLVIFAALLPDAGLRAAGDGAQVVHRGDAGSDVGAPRRRSAWTASATPGSGTPRPPSPASPRTSGTRSC